MAVAKTYPKTFISDLLFLSKEAHKLENFTLFSNFAFLTNTIKTHVMKTSYQIL